MADMLMITNLNGISRKYELYISSPLTMLTYFYSAFCNIYAFLLGKNDK